MKFEARIHPTSKDSFRSCQAVSKLVRMGVGVGVGAVSTTTCQGDVIITRTRLRLPDDLVLIMLYATCLHWQRALMLLPHEYLGRGSLRLLIMSTRSDNNSTKHGGTTPCHSVHQGIHEGQRRAARGSICGLTAREDCSCRKGVSRRASSAVPLDSRCSRH